MCFIVFRYSITSVSAGRSHSAVIDGKFYRLSTKTVLTVVCHQHFHSNRVVYSVEALVSRHPLDTKKVSVTGADRLRGWFS